MKKINNKYVTFDNETFKKIEDANDYLLSYAANNLKILLGKDVDGLKMLKNYRVVEAIHKMSDILKDLIVEDENINNQQGR